MANTEYITASALEQEQSALRKKMALAGGIIALITLFVFPFGAVFVALATIAICANAGGAKQAGMEGERKARNILSMLPDNYYLFNDVKIYNPQSPKGYTPLDYVAVGDNGIFVIEVKHINGSISGRDTDGSWTVHKVGRQGGAYTSSIKNPVKQVNGQVYALKSFLQSKGLNPWIQGVLLFTHPNCRLNVAHGVIPSFSDRSINSFIRGFSSTTPPEIIEHAKCQIAGIVVANAG